MQDKDFDQFIRKAAESFPEPAYNPADWDRLEDRLHNLNSPQNQPGVNNPLRKFGFGKAAMVASAVVVTAVNALLFVNSDKAKTDSPANIQTAVATQQVVSDNPEQTTVAGNAVSTSVSRPQETVQTTSEIALAASKTAAVTIQTPAVSASAPNSISNLPVSKTTKTSTSRNTQNRSNNAQSFSASTWNSGIINAVNPLNSGRNNVLSGGYKPNGAGAINTDGCLGNNLPEIAYAVVNSDTIYGSRIALSGCQPVAIKFITQDKDADQITVTSNISEILPGASVIMSKMAQPTLDVQLPLNVMARQQPYSFTIWLKDNRCPNATPKAFNFTLSVTPAFTVSVNGITNLEKGESTTLQAMGAPAGSTFKWSGKGLNTTNNAAKIEVKPTENTVYAVLVTAPGGCSYSDSARILVTEPQAGDNAVKSKSIPNIFTPNGDGVNDYFEVKLPEEGPYSLVVFDRWSKKVYSSAKYQNNWEAENLPAGTYYYVITTTQDHKTYRGWVEVVR